MPYPGAIETNITPAAPTGTTVTGSGTAHTKGAWAELIAATGAASDGIWVAIRSVGASGTDTGILLDIGIGAAASETVHVPDINGGYAGDTSSMGQLRFIPILTASGVRVSARLQGVVTTETALVSIWLSQSIQHLTGAVAVEAVGEDGAASQGTSVTSGNNAWGSWTNMGTISADRNLFMPGVDGLGDTSFAGSDDDILLELGHGTTAPDSGGTAIPGAYRWATNTGEEMFGPVPNVPVYADLASGETLWARMSSGNAVVRGVVIHAMEGVAVAGGGSTLIRR